MPARTHGLLSLYVPRLLHLRGWPSAGRPGTYVPFYLADRPPVSYHPFILHPGGLHPHTLVLVSPGCTLTCPGPIPMGFPIPIPIPIPSPSSASASPLPWAWAWAWAWVGGHPFLGMSPTGDGGVGLGEGAVIGTVFGALLGGRGGERSCLWGVGGLSCRTWASPRKKWTSWR